MIANSAHFPALNVLRKEGLVEVVGVADIREEVAAETAKRHGDCPKIKKKRHRKCRPTFVNI